MRRAGVLVLGILTLLTFQQALAADAVITVKGYTPRMVEEGLADRVTSGIPNVGKLCKVYLIANERDAGTYTYGWTLSRPAGSTTTLSSTTTKEVWFIPDLVGTYTAIVTVSDTTSDSDTMKVNAGTWLGVASGCNGCHAAKYASWDSTGHAHFLQERLSTGPAYYSASCIHCHTVGFDTLATNNGFDDRMTQYGWTFPSPFTPDPANWTNLVNNYPQVAALANIQCENCHGPGSQHYSVTSDNKMVASLSAANCGQCHDEPPHHVYFEQWESSLHSHQAEETSSSCQKCHNGTGFVNFAKGVPNPTPFVYQNISCSVCHDPHSVSNPSQVRIMSTVMLSDTLTYISSGGKGKLCMNCHKSRRHATTYVNAPVTNPNTHFGPHGSTQADVLAGANGITFGQTYGPGAHASTENACVTCHMSTNPSDTLVGQHTWKMEHNDMDNVAACLMCHPGISDFEDIMATSDYDGDGTTEPAMVEVEGLIEYLGSLLPTSIVNWSVDSTWTLVQRQAGYVYMTAEEDGSKGAHNMSYIVGTLQDAITALGVGVVEIPQATLPLKFAMHPSYPNPFNPATTIRFDVAKLSNVRINVYNLAGQVVTTLVDKEIQPGTYQTTFSADFLSSGLYIARMEADNQAFTQKLMLVK